MKKTNKQSDKSANDMCQGFIERTIAIIEELGISDRKFAQFSEISTSGLNQVLLGYNYITLHTIYKILIAYPRINPDYWINGKGKMWLKNVSQESEPATPTTPAAKPVKSGSKKTNKGS